MTKEVKFEDSLHRLESIVEKLEGGSLSLEDSLKVYEEGMNLSQQCQKRLGEAQKKIELLVKDAEGNPETKEWAPGDSEAAKKKKK